MMTVLYYTVLTVDCYSLLLFYPLYVYSDD